MSIITIEIDLAKTIFAVHGVNESGKAERSNESSARAVAATHFKPAAVPDRHGSLYPPHYWTRMFRQHGHNVRLITPKFVIPYRMSGKPL